MFDLQEQLGEEVQQRLQKAMDYMRRISQEAVAPPQQGRAGAAAKGKAKSAVPYKVLLDHKPEFDRILGVTVPKPTFHLLAKAEFSPYLEAMVSQVLAQFLRQGVISSRAILKPEPREILVRRLPSRQEAVERPPFAFIELDEGRKSAAGYCRDVAVEVSAADRWLVCDLTQLLLVPNVSPNWAETHERQQARLQELKPVYFKVKRGEMLVREGERITPLHLVKLQAQSKIYPRSRGVLIFLGLFFCLAVLLGVSYQLARITLRRFSTPFAGPDFCGGPAPGQHPDEQGAPGAGGQRFPEPSPGGPQPGVRSAPGIGRHLSRHVPGAGDRGGGGLSQRHLRGPGGG